MNTSSFPAQARLSRRRKTRLQRCAPANASSVPTQWHEAPFDPPDIDDVLSLHEAEADEQGTSPTRPLLDLVEPAPVMEPLELTKAAADDAETLRAFAPSAMRDAEAPGAPAPEVERRGQYQPPANSALKYKPRKDDLNETPVPPISIYASWDRPEIAETFAHFAADPHIARADVRIERGGLDGAIAHCAEEKPDLLIIDTTLGSDEMLAGLDRLARVLDHTTKLIIVGAVNDVALLRALAARGVAEYIVPPSRRNDLIRTACRLFADAHTARVFAVVGARGGVGASTLAQNLAWSIAERQQARVALIDLDLPFGATAFSLADAAPSLEALDTDSHFVRQRATRSERLEIVAVTDAFKRDVRCDEATLEATIRAAARLNSYVVLDVPHEWNAWVKRAVAGADETIIVASSDLASLRNAEGMLRQIRAAKSRATPLLALSMVGMRKNCEIPRKDFFHAIGMEAIVEFAFEPDLFGLCALKGQLLGEAAPKAKAALDIDALATTLTGRAPVKRHLRERATQIEPVKPKSAPRRRVATATEPNLIEYPLTFLKPGERRITPEVAQLALAPSAAHQLATICLVAERAGPPAPGPARRALRMAALVTLLLQSLAWTMQAQHETADAAEPPPIAATAQPAAVTPASVNPLAALMHDAEDGSALAQYELAQHYRAGDGTPADPIAAMRWTERAAENGHCRAMHDLGVAYARGDGAARDDAAAFRWFHQAAAFDVADSQYNLGLLYQQGVGVSASMPEALFWFRRAALSGDAAAAERADMLQALLPPADVEQAQARARAFQPRQPGAAFQCGPEAAAPTLR